MRKSIITVLEPTAPVYDLTTVDAVNAALGITGNTATDAITGDQITQVSKIIGELCDRVFALLTVEESFRMVWGDPVRAVNLRQYPVTELQSIMVSGSPVDPFCYELDYEAGLLWSVNGLWHGEMVVQYSGGYDLPTGAPALLAQACIDTIRAQRSGATSRDPSIRSTTHGDTTVTFSNPTTTSITGSSILPASANDMIQQFKRLGV